ncbi:hypothetical protein [Parasedimentitalea psychrophila]|uniref:Uncharacterized protein n=1 Tax=Parasedimentitalea psychrophila TaxID=2997337 RepID=A0A9Y2P356_9RHOB|nr:hypothetical protein [Parasedimentitalea psychrophila]WIY27331.1 hypothetical protein QPJ95_10665 [Parasedimentitalea psychrophila]
MTGNWKPIAFAAIAEASRVSLFAYLNGLGQGQAARILAQRFGVAA